MKKFLILILLIFLVTGCAIEISEPEQTTLYGEVERGARGVSRFIDEEAGVVCWIYNGYNKGGLSCLPIADTLLGK